MGDTELSVSKIYNNNTSTQTLAVYTFDNPDDIVAIDQYSVTINGIFFLVILPVNRIFY